MRSRIRTVVGVALLSAAGCDTAAVDLGDPPGAVTIAQADLRADLEALAHDTMQGRLAGAPEAASTADWIAQRFGALGLTPAGDGDTYLQTFRLVTFALGNGANELVVGGRPGQLGTDFYPLHISASGEASGPVTFVGYGIHDPRIPHSDFGDTDLEGRVLLMMDGEPDPDDPRSPFDGVVRSEASRHLRKVWEAQARGAVAVLFVADVANDEPAADLTEAFPRDWPEDPPRIDRFSISEWTDRVEIPVARVSRALAGRLAAGVGTTLEALAQEAQADGGTAPRALGPARVELRSSVDRRYRPGRNILAQVTGGNPDLAHEHVLVSAHYDHNGADEGGVFNGADDNASGTVGVLEIAAAYAEAAAQGARPDRTVVFALWDAEERGLLGAWHYTILPRRPLADLVAVLNLDMIGRNEEVPAEPGPRFRGLQPQTAESNQLAVNVLGTTYSTALRTLLEPMAGPHDLELRFRYNNNASNLLRRSDHWPFLQNGVPAVWFHTGLHPDYHTRADDTNGINYAKMTRIVRLVHDASWQLATAPGRPVFER